MAAIDVRQTALERRRYDRIAGLYDAFAGLMERRAQGWRRELWALAGAGTILELGVGTGQNLAYYPRDRAIVAVDLSPLMLERARDKARRIGVQPRLEVADAQCLPFANGSFDVVIATFLFCSVPNPALGLAEARRVLKPGGKLLLLEHVLSERPLLRLCMRWLDPLPFHLWGAHIQRETVHAVRAAGFVEVLDTNLALDVVKRIEARVRRVTDSVTRAT